MKTKLPSSLSITLMNLKTNLNILKNGTEDIDRSKLSSKDTALLEKADKLRQEINGYL